MTLAADATLLPRRGSQASSNDEIWKICWQLPHGWKFGANASMPSLYVRVHVTAVTASNGSKLRSSATRRRWPENNRALGGIREEYECEEEYIGSHRHRYRGLGASLEVGHARLRGLANTIDGSCYCSNTAHRATGTVSLRCVSSI